MKDMREINQASEYIKDLLGEKQDVKAQYEVSEITTKEINVENGDFTLFRTLFDKEVNIKVIANQKTGNISANSFEKDALKAALDGVILSAESGTEDECFDIAPRNEEAEFTIGCLEPDIDGLMKRSKEFMEDVTREYPNIVIMLMVIQHRRKDTVYRNTNGSCDKIHSGGYSMLIEYAGNDGTNTSGISFAQIDFKDLSRPILELGRLKKDMEEAEKSVCPVPVTGKFEGKIIFTPACFKKMIQLCGMVALEDSEIIEGSSLWAGKIGETVASEKLSVSINPWDKRITDHEVVTVDGFRSEDFDVIKDGKLCSYLTTLYGANKAGVERARNSSEESIVVSPGDTELSDMIKNVDKGLLLGNISCGFPGVSGELSGVAKNAFYIENGKIKEAVTETMVSFNVVHMLKDITSISEELICDGRSVLPYVCADHMMISGAH